MVIVLTTGGCVVVQKPPVPAPAPVRPVPKAVAPAVAREGREAVDLKVARGGGGVQVLVGVRIAGHGPYDFVLDTGASFSSIDRRLARRLNLPRAKGRVRVSGATGTAALRRVKVRAWSLGPYLLGRTTMPVIDLNGAAHGLLGADELHRFGTVKLNFTTGRLLLGGS